MMKSNLKSMKLEEKIGQKMNKSNQSKRNPIYGAIFGDIVGSRFQMNPIKTKNFFLITKESHITDDTIMTLAIERAIIAAKKDISLLSEYAIKHMRFSYLLYPMMDYGTLFKEWLISKNPQPYQSYGNGGAMRVSACGVYFDTLEESLLAAKAVTTVTHDHEEGLKAALATTEAIYLARMGHSKEHIQKAMEKYYDISQSLDDLRKDYTFDASATYTMIGVLTSFFESKSFLDAIRNAVSLGGDSDTLAAITGSIAASYYGLSQRVIDRVSEYISFELNPRKRGKLWK